MFISGKGVCEPADAARAADCSTAAAGLRGAAVRGLGAVSGMQSSSYICTSNSVVLQLWHSGLCLDELQGVRV
jgi:hypothetical protein